MADTLAKFPEKTAPVYRTKSAARRNEQKWKPLGMFTEDEFIRLIKREVRDLNSSFATIQALHKFCVDKFGHAPEIPELRAAEPVEA